MEPIGTKSMIVSVTEIENYYRCPRKWDITSLNRRRLTPIKPQEPLEIGTLIHEAGAKWIAQPDCPFSEHLMQVATDRLAKLVTVYRTALDMHIPVDVYQDYNKWVTLARHMCENYEAYYKTPLPKSYTLVQPEQQVSVAIPNTEHCSCMEQHDDCVLDCPMCEHPKHQSICTCIKDTQTNPCLCVEPHYLAGQLDAIIADSKGRHFVYERKTYGQRPNLTHLQRNWQFLAYNWILDVSTPDAAGIAYDGLWKRATVPDGKTTADLFFRYYMSRSPAELDNFEKYLTETVLEMAGQPSTGQRYLRPVIPAVKGCIDDLSNIPICDAMSDDNKLPLKGYVLRDMSPAFLQFYGLEA